MALLSSSNLGLESHAECNAAWTVLKILHFRTTEREALMTHHQQTVERSVETRKEGTQEKEEGHQRGRLSCSRSTSKPRWKSRYGLQMPLGPGEVALLRNLRILILEFQTWKELQGPGGQLLSQKKELVFKEEVGKKKRK
jgi:hypothetical protein